MSFSVRRHGEVTPKDIAALLLKSARTWNIPAELATQVMKRDLVCIYCRQPFQGPDGDKRNWASWEHIINDLSIVTLSNIALACHGCNSSKGARPLQQWLESHYCKSRSMTRKTIATVAATSVEPKHEGTTSMPQISQRSQPLQNRVDPWGELRALRVVGNLMGNRGILHDENDRIVRNWANKSWVCCSLSATFQKRSPFSPGTYSELFFLDEATAYAAGHRPCRTCRRAEHDRFNQAWTAANAGGASGRGCLPIREIDAALHAERVGPDRRKRTHSVRLSDLPVGAMFKRGGDAVLVGPNGLRLWSFGGYQPYSDLPEQTLVELLTPPSVAAAIQHGLIVEIHPSGH